MKSFKKYLTPEEQIKELSLTEKAWQSAKQKIAENKELSPEEQKLIDDFLGIQPEPEPEPIVEEVVEEQVQYQLVTGPQGEQGPQGIPGEKGEKGDQGEKGEQGIPGEKGERGERGLAGLNGLRGEKGDKGDQGIQGERGDVGPQGEQGLSGRDGADGVKGDKGDQGIAGRDGVDGKDGAPGQKGDKGDRGEKGQDGKNGLNGKDGRDGKDGAKGDKGDRGERGEKGEKGDDGETPDIKPFFEKFNKLSLDINKKVGRIASDMGALATTAGSGSYWLNDLGDTDYSSIVNATDQQVLTYNEATKKWIAADSQGGGGGGTLDQWARNRANAAFIQANTPSYVANSAASYANSAFITANAAFDRANIQSDWNAATSANAAFIFNKPSIPTLLDDLTDVLITGVTNDQVLTYNTVQGKWINAATTSIAQNAATGYYGSFYDMTTQSVAADNANTAMMFNTTAESNGVIIDPAANTHVKVLYSGTYNFQFSSQFHNTGGGGSGTTVTVWFAINGQPVANSATNIAAPSNSPYVVAAWNLILTMNAGDYLEMIWSTDNHHIVMDAIQPTATIPGIPSVILTVQQVTNVVASNVQFAYTQANSAFNTANAAFLQANTPSYTANSAASYANSAFITANSAGVYANSAFAAANAATATDATQNTNIASASSYANSAFLVANTPSHVANSASSYANSAFTKANTAITTSGGSITGQLNVTYQPATTVNTALAITAANTIGGTGYADFFKLTNSSAGTTNPNKYIRIGPTGTFEIINSAYNAVPMYMTDNGDLFLSGNLTMSGAQAGYSSNRPGFRVYGANTTNNLSTTQNGTGQLNYNNWAIDYNQGSYLNHTTGTFTAPLAGLYQICLNTRNAGNAAYSQLACCKNGASQVLVMIEFAGNSTMNHTGGSTVAKLVAGDTLNIRVLAGTINFDGNDNWSVTYLG